MDRRFVLAIVLMMVVLIVPQVLLKKPPRPQPAAGVVPAAPGAQPPVTAPTLVAPPGSEASPLSVETAEAATAEDTVRVSSGLYEYAFSTRGGRMVEADLRSTARCGATNPGRPPRSSTRAATS
ncbi:MAG: hypothetical protein R2882_00275 [Gemmatimonadales bacterium]